MPHIRPVKRVRENDNAAVNLRNIAIIAHVDHGKTTLVDGLLRQRGAAPTNSPCRSARWTAASSYASAGITILAKYTAIHWRGVLNNIVDTPGHADIGGDVKRVLGMVDDVLVLVDAAEGPTPQTRFALEKALRLSLRLIVAISKMDRADTRAEIAHEAVFGLLDALGSTEAQLDFRTDCT